MATTEGSFLAKGHNPPVQAAAVFIASVAVMLGGKLVAASGLMDVGQRFPWMTAASFMLFFAVGNSLLSLPSKDLNRYWGRSMFSFGGLAMANGLVAWGLSSVPIDEAGSYRWIFIVVTFGYLVFLSMVGILKRIVEFAQREEWNHPRMRNKNRKK